MVPGQDPLEQRALAEAQELISHSPREAAEKLRTLVSKYKIAGNAILALEARRFQCFALTCDMRLEEARRATLTLLSEAMQVSEKKYLGIGEMYLGNIALEAGQWDIAAEYYDEAMRIARELDDEDLMARVSLNLGNAFLQLE
ncbi:MAG TPA: tetratricopeptide repeat protein, partial [Fimbriimonas sp.]|nr:tetratricopeptide repeat protein [Fimbriimonas sp.]